MRLGVDPLEVLHSHIEKALSRKMKSSNTASAHAVAKRTLRCAV
jgi:hypothetical protein